ncbi:MAG: response regulator, partial [Desulfobacterales bacterium]|nr:response regulator [Desulfobacterales bacterium]
MNNQFPILMAEDDHLSRMILEEHLADAGYEVTSAVNGREALDMFRDRFFPIIITDWVMPEMDGPELCRAIRSEEGAGYVYIIIVTFKGTREAIMEGLEAGADDYLTKPVDYMELVARLNAGKRVLRLETSLRESNEKLKTQLQFIESLGNTVPNPVFYQNEGGAYLGCNKAMADLILGAPAREIVGKTVFDLKDAFSPESVKMHHDEDMALMRRPGVRTYESRVKCKDGVRRDFLINKAAYTDAGGVPTGIVGVMLDLTEKNNLMRKQEMNIDLAKKIMRLVNASPPRRVDLPAEAALFTHAISLSCYAEGGDHFFTRTIRGGDGGGARKTILSLKDQSGHEVGCVLRSIITDLIHNALTPDSQPGDIEGTMTSLNNEICRSRFFNPEDFVTAITAEIDHKSLLMRYVSAGHPPFLLIRGDEITELPPMDGEGHNMALGVFGGIAFTAGEYSLQKGDKLLFYTDGLTEASVRNRRKMIESEELESVVRGALTRGDETSVIEVMHGLLEAVSTIADETILPESHPDGPRNTSTDDVTLLGLEIERLDNWKEAVFQPRDSEELSEKIRELYQEIRGEWRRRGFESPGARLRAMLEEALVNAWEHGNGRDPDKSITVRRRYGNDF